MPTAATSSGAELVSSETIFWPDRNNGVRDAVNTMNQRDDQHIQRIID